MSLVGPRPHAIVHDEYYLRTIPGYELRFKAKPGITGLAQISGFRGSAHPGHMMDRVARDVEYIRNWSVVADIQILFRTLLIVPFDAGAY
jgi:putative colanic acid biosynthesis UDP-glucose lipid carrier transferase